MWRIFFSYLYEMIVTRMRIIDKKSEKERNQKKNIA